MAMHYHGTPGVVNPCWCGRPESKWPNGIKPEPGDRDLRVPQDEDE